MIAENQEFTLCFYFSALCNGNLPIRTFGQELFLGEISFKM